MPLKLFKQKIDPDKVFEKAASGIDKLFFTNEEKSEAAMKYVEAHSDFVKSTLNASTVSSKTRRYIGVTLVSIWLALHVFGVIAYKVNPDWSKLTFKTANDLNPHAILVLAFYFGSYALNRNLLPIFGGRDKKRRKQKDG